MRPGQIGWRAGFDILLRHECDPVRYNAVFAQIFQPT